MLPRVLTAVVGIPLLVYVATVRSLVPAIAMFFLLAVLMAVEIGVAERSRRMDAPFALLALSKIPFAVIVLAVVLHATVDELILYASIAAIAGLIIACYFRFIKRILFPPYMLWIGLPVGCVIVLRAFDSQTTSGWWIFQFGSALLLLFLCLWAGDTAAYLVGRAFGRHKLAPTISPNKTWEGATANLLAASAVGYFAADWCGLTLPLGVAVGTIVGVCGQVGDLYESAWKRSLGIKDSGNLLPGHGGFLDRFDSLLFAAPPVAALLYSGWLR